MPTKTTDANAVSSAAKQESSASSGGNQAQKTPEQLAAEYKAEAERKQEVIDGLRESQEAMQAEMADLKALVEAGQATRAEEARLQALGGANQDIESQIALMENDPKNRLGFMSIDRRIERYMAKMETRVQAAEIAGEQKALGKLQVGLLEDTAEELGVEYDVLIRKLKPIAANFQYDSNGNPINVYRKAQLAIRKYKSILEAEKKAEAERLEAAKANGSRETGTREAREPSTLDNKSKRLVPGNFGEEMGKLGL